MKRPSEREYAPYYSTYVSFVPEADVMAALERQPQELRDLTGGLATERETFRYAPGKWSIREAIGHIIDTERVFGHRAFCISRGEVQPLPGFDQNDYMAAADFDQQPLTDLVKEFAVVREANLLALRRLRADDWDRTGTASSHPVSVRALAFMMAGHVRHHCGVLRERYGVVGSR